jgi:predicted  nucleic acid-binding Zn-ribbon protein
MSKREEFLSKMGNRLKEWNVEVDKLEEKVLTVKSELQGKYRQQIADLRQKRVEAEKKLAEIKASGEGAWESLKGESERAWTALKDGVAAFKAHYQDETEEKDQTD